MSSSTQWQWRAFLELTPAELYAALRLRAEVFIVEQNCPYLDLDDCDQACDHLLGWQEGRLVAYLRLVPPGVKYAEPSLGRVITSASVRRTGVGRELFQVGLEECLRRWPGQAIRIGAQAYLERFYGSFGFVAESDYVEDGIPHLLMVREKAKEPLPE